MNVLGATAAVGAFANYQNAKKEYDAIVEKRDALQAAVQSYVYGRLDDYIDKNYNEKPLNYPKGIQMSSILRVGNLVGDVFHAKPSIVLSNTSNQAYYIGSVEMNCVVLDCPILISRLAGEWWLFNAQSETQQQTVSVGKMLQPGETLEIGFPGGTTGIVNKNGQNNIGELRQLVCDACGKKLITSCKSVSIEGVEKADIQILWGERQGVANEIARYIGLPGILRYMNEAYYEK